MFNKPAPMSIQAYQNQQDWEILGASPLELVRALYRGALQATTKARVALANGNIQDRSRAISKACAIVQELTISLNREAAPELTTNLAELYVYMHRRLGDANVEQSDAPLAEVERLLGVLLEAWEGLAASESSVSSGEPLRLSA